MGFIRDLTGKTAANRAGQAGELQAGAALEAADLQVQAGKDASALLNPFAQIGQQGIDQANFLTDPNAQFQFLQNNPLFQSAIASGDRNVDRLLQSSAARGRLSAGDTMEQLQTIGQQNVLSNAMPFIQNQQSNIGSLLNYGMSTAANQGNLLTGQAAAGAGGITSAAAAQAGGMIGEANARGQSAQNILNLGMQAAGFFSDPKLKENIQYVGKLNGFNIYTWTWNKVANALGLQGNDSV